MTQQQRREWSLVACLAAVFMVVYGGGFLTFGVFLTPLVKHFGWSRTRVSALYGIVSLAMAPIQPLVGWLVERIESWSVMTAGAIALVVGFLLASRADSFEGLVTAYALMGLGVGAATMVPCFAVTANWFKEGRRGLAMGLVGAGAALGGILMPLLASHAIYSFGWRAGYLALAVPIIVIILPWVAIVVRNHPPATDDRGRPAPEGVEPNVAIKQRAFWLLMFGYFLFTFTLTMPLGHLIPYLLGRGYGHLAATSIYSAMQAMAIPGSIIIGRLGDRIGGRFTVAFCYAVSALGLLMLVDAGRSVALILFVLCYGLTFIAPSSMLPLLLSEVFGLKRFALFSGFGTFMISIGGALGPLTAGRIFDVTGGYQAVFAIAAGFAAAGAIAMAAVPAPTPSVRVAAERARGAEIREASISLADC